MKNEIANTTVSTSQVGKLEKTYLRLDACDLKTADGSVVKGYAIDLKDALASGGASLNLEVEVVLDGMLAMYPAELTQKESQLVRFTGNHYVYSPYKVKSQTTKVQLTSDKVESYSKVSTSTNIIYIFHSLMLNTLQQS